MQGMIPDELGHQPVARNRDRRRSKTLLDAVWAPIPWMLEVMFVLLFALGDYTGMMTVAVLLGFNVAFGVAGESYARVRAERGRRPR